MSCKQFTVLNPKGEEVPSILADHLIQKYGRDEAARIWSWVHSPEFKEPYAKDDRDANGEPTFAYVEKALSFKPKIAEQNLPQNFLKNLADQHNPSLEPDSAEVKKALDASFVQMRDADGKPTGQHWDIHKQNDVVDSILRMLYNQYVLHGDWSVSTHKDEVFNRLNNFQKLYQAAAAGNNTILGKLNVTPEEAANRAGIYQQIVRDFHRAGEENGFWNFALQKLKAMKIDVVREKKESVLDENAEDAAIHNESGQGLRDFYDDVFKVDVKDTASTRMKMFLMSMTRSKWGTGDMPREIKLPFSNAELRQQVEQGKRSYTVRTPEALKELGLSTEVPAGLSESEKKRKTEAVTRVNNKLVRVSIDRPLTEADLAKVVDKKGNKEITFWEKLKAEEGIDAKPGDVRLSLEPFERRNRELTDETNFLGLPALADYEDTFSKLVGALSGIKPGYDNYIRALKETTETNPQVIAALQAQDPLFQQVINKLEAADQTIRNEFVSVMGTHYQEQQMTLYSKSRDGFIQPRIINSNRAGELNTIQDFWKESQKNSEMLVRDENGNTVINRPLAQELHQQMLEVQKATGAEKREKGIALLKRVLEANGIVMNEKAINDFIENAGKLTKKTAFQGSFEAQFATSQQGNPLGLVSTLITAFNRLPEQSAEEGAEETPTYQASNPLYTEGSAMKILAKLEARYSQKIYTQTHRNAKGDSVFAYGFNTALSHAVRDVKEDAAFRKRYESSPFARNSWLLEDLNAPNDHKERFHLFYVDGIKKQDSTKDGVTRPDMSNREQWMTLLAFFQNNGSREFANYVSLTHSDKTTSPVYGNAPRMQNVYINVSDRQGGSRWVINPKVVERVFHSVFKAEYDRIVEHDKQNFNIKGYNEGKKHFYFLPAFNLEEMRRMEKKGMLTKDEVNALYPDGKIVPTLNAAGKQVVEKLIRHQLAEIVEATKKSWKDSGLLEAGLPGSKRYFNALLKEHGLVPDRKDEAGQWWRKDTFTPTTTQTEILHPDQVKEEMLQLAAADYALNSFVFNTSLAQVFFGDPALFWKKSVEGTLTEYGKRLAGDIAPGRDGNWEPGTKYTTVTAEDYQPIAHELAGIPGYEGKLDGSDAQELTTVKEHLDVLYHYGKDITDNQYKKAMKVIREAKGGYYDFKESDPELHSLLMQPMKPVAFGMRDAGSGLLMLDYVKSSSYALYPPVTAGLELDKLRKAMEDPDTGVQRLNFLTTKKTGAPAKALTLFSADGKINEEVFKSPDWTTNSRQVLDRTEFRLQQEVPYDKEKKEVPVVSQLNWNIVQGIPTVNTPFTFRGEQKTGAELRQIKEDIMSRLVQYQHQSFLKEVGAHYNEKTGLLEFHNKKKLYQLLAKEIKSRSGYSLNDLAAIDSFTKDGKLTLPLMFTPSFSKMEGKLMSLIEDVVNIKIPGKSFIQASPAGFKASRDFESLTTEEKNKIVWTAPHTGELKTAHLSEDGKTVNPAQILVSANFFRRHGINIEDYVNPETKLVDTDRIPRELFQLIGARIPNAGHNSSLPIEIAGFLPDEMGDIAVVPAAITKQMGSDFDVDKLYSYNRTFRKNGDKLELVTASTDDRDAEYTSIQELKNQYVDLHWSVLTNPEMFHEMMAPLDAPDLKEQAELLEQKKGIPYYFSPAHQVAEFQSNQEAKAGVGMSALAIDNNVKMEDKDIRIGKLVLDKKTGDRNEEIIPIRLLDDKGQTRELTHLSGYAVSTYIDKNGNPHQRTKAQNLSIFNGEFVDDAKNKVMGKLNLNSATFPAAQALIRLQEEDTANSRGWAADHRYVANLLVQPVIREYAFEMAKTTDTMSTGFGNAQDRVMQQLHDKYSALLKGKQPEEILLNPEKLSGMLKTKPGTPEFAEQQLAVLSLFRDLDEIGRQLMTLQSITKQDTRGAGDSMLSAISTQMKREKFATDDRMNRHILGAVEQMFTGEVGTMYNATVSTARDVYAEDLPYEKLQPLYSWMAEQKGVPDLGDEQKDTVFRAVKSFAYAQNNLGLWTDGEKTRLELLYSREGKPSLAQRTLEAKQTWGKGVYLIERLGTDISPDGMRPDYVTYQASKVTNVDDVENGRSWLWMLTNKDETIRKYGEDLLRYTLLTGGIQNANNIVRYEPFAYLAGTAISEGLREFHVGLGIVGMHPLLIEQTIQHNPAMAVQLSDKMKETGQEYEQAPDQFILPKLLPGVEKQYDYEGKDSNPAAGLVIRKKSPDGSSYEDYATYLSYKQGNKWILYKQMPHMSEEGVFYGRIDTLGDSKYGFSEYSMVDGTARSAIPENRSPVDWQSPDKLVLSHENNDYVLTPGGQQERTLRQVGLMKTEGNYADIVNALHVISADPQQPSHLRVMAKALAEIDRHTVENDLYKSLGKLERNFSFNIEKMKPKASFFGIQNRLAISADGIVDKQKLAESITHELFHYHTSWLLTAMASEQEWKRRNFAPELQGILGNMKSFIERNHPELVEKVKALDGIRLRAGTALKQEFLKSHTEQEWDDKVKAITNQDAAGDKWDKLMYGMMSTTEFMPHIFTSPDVMDFLNRMPYEGKKTMLVRIKELISGLWAGFLKAMGVNTDSLLEESISRGLDIMSYQKSAEGFLQSAGAVDLNLMHHNIDYDDIVTAPAVSNIDKVIGRLEEELGQLRDTYTGVTEKEARAYKSSKIQQIKEHIEQLREQKTDAMVAEVGKKQLKWVAAVAAMDHPTDNQINTARKIADVWRGIINMMYGDGVAAVDPELAKLAAEANTHIFTLNQKTQQYLTDLSQGVIRSAEDWDKELKDTTWYQSGIRSLHSAAESRVIQTISGFIETTGRHRDMELQRVLKVTKQLEDEMIKKFGSRQALQQAYKQIIREPASDEDKTLKTRQMYSSKWAEWRRKTIADRNGALARVREKYKGDMENPLARQERRLIWSNYRKEVVANSVYVDTRKFFEPETGELKEGYENHLKTLADKVGEDHAEELMRRAQKKYKEYLEDRNIHFDLWDEEAKSDEKTQEEVDADKGSYRDRNSPNRFFDGLDGRNLTETSDHNVVIAPLKEKTEFWDERFREIMADPKLKELNDRYTELIGQLISYLPKTVQEHAGSNFIPYVNRMLVSEIVDVPRWVKTMSERMIKNLTATSWEEKMNEKAYHKIPLQFINPNEVPVEERSTDLVRAAEVFAAMAIHYKHFSAAKDVIDMGKAILQEIDRTRQAGNAQIEQNGRYVTADKGLKNALDALKYLEDYSVYRKPKELEFKGGKLYVEKEFEKNPDGTVKRDKDGNPVVKSKKYYHPLAKAHKHVQIFERVNKLLAEREQLEKRYTEQIAEDGKEPLTEEEFLKLRQPIDDELAKYEGLRLYGSKLGDKLIGINQLKALSYNPFSAVSNWGFGVLSVFVHAAGGRDFTDKEAGWAFWKMLHATGKWASLGKVQSEDAMKIYNIMENLGVMGDFVDTMYGKGVIHRDRVPEWKKKLSPFELMRSSDYFIKGLTTLAVMKHEKVEVTIDGEKKTISLWDAFGKDGKWDEKKYGERPEWFDKDVTKQQALDKFTNKLLAVNMILHGNQDKNSPKRINSKIMGRLLGQFRTSWLPEGWYNRFQNKHYDSYLDRDVEGRYRTAAGIGIGGTLKILSRQLANLVPGVKVDPFTGVVRDGKALDATDIENMRRNFRELAWWGGVTASIMMLKHMNNDDDDSGNFAIQLLINSLIRGKQDIEFYANPNVFDQILRDPIPALNVLKDYGAAIHASSRFITDDDYEFQQWLLKQTKAGIPVPQTSLINKTAYMAGRDLDTYSR